jgi:hypothetical protein
MSLLPYNYKNVLLSAKIGPYTKVIFDKKTIYCNDSNHPVERFQIPPAAWLQIIKIDNNSLPDESTVKPLTDGPSVAVVWNLK